MKADAVLFEAIPQHAQGSLGHASEFRYATVLLPLRDENVAFSVPHRTVWGNKLARDSVFGGQIWVVGPLPDFRVNTKLRQDTIVSIENGHPTI